MYGSFVGSPILLPALYAQHAGIRLPTVSETRPPVGFPVSCPTFPRRDLSAQFRGRAAKILSELACSPSHAPSPRVTDAQFYNFQLLSRYLGVQFFTQPLCFQAFFSWPLFLPGIFKDRAYQVRGECSI